MTKAELVAALKSSGEDAVTALRALPESAFEAGRYENGWNAKQILAHIASIEWTYPQLLELGAQASATAGGGGQTSAAATPARRMSAEEAGGLPTRAAAGGIDSYNDRQVEKRAGISIGDLIAEFAKNRAATVAAVEAAEDDLFSRPIRSAGGITGALADVLNAVAVQHVSMHVADIAGANWTGTRF